MFEPKFKCAITPKLHIRVSMTVDNTAESGDPSDNSVTVAMHHENTHKIAWLTSKEARRMAKALNRRADECDARELAIRWTSMHTFAGEGVE